MLLLLLFAAAVIFLWEYLLIEPQTAMAETIVESGCGGELSFTAAFPQIVSVIPNNEDPSIERMLEVEHISVAVQILREDGSLAGMAYGEDVPIHTNGYISTEACQLSGLPIELNVGERYTLKYDAVSGDRGLPNLSFALYGGHKNLKQFGRGVILIAVLFCMGMFSLAFVGQRIAKLFWFSIVWILLLVPYLWTMPLEQHDSEASHFAGAYQLATGQQGNAAVLSNENTGNDGDIVYIEESGLRNMAYLSYSVPLNRFWTDKEYGNVLTQGMTGTLYQEPAADRDPGMFLRAAAIRLARYMGVSYQFKYLSGALVAALVSLLLMNCILYLMTDDKDSVLLIMCLFMLPSFVRSVLYYSGRFLFVLAVVTMAAAVFQRINRRENTASYADTVFVKSAVDTVPGKSTGDTGVIVQEIETKKNGKCSQILKRLLIILSVAILIWYALAWFFVDGASFVRNLRSAGVMNSIIGWLGNAGWRLNSMFLRLLYGSWSDKSHLMIPSVVFLFALWSLIKRAVYQNRSSRMQENGLPLAVIGLMSFLVSLQYFL